MVRICSYAQCDELEDSTSFSLRFNIVLALCLPVLSTLEPLPGMEDSIVEASDKASKYEWAKSAEIYRRILEKIDRQKDSVHAADVSDIIGKSYFKAAFQSHTREDFQQTMTLSEKAYSEASGLYEASGLEALAKRAEAGALFSGFWILDGSEEKRAVLEKSVGLAQEALQIFEVHGDRQNIAETLLDLLVYREKAVHLSIERSPLVNVFESALENAWRIIEEPDLAGDPTILGTIHTLAQLYFVADYVLEQPRYEELERRLARLRDRIVELAEKIGTTNARALCNEALMVLSSDLEGDVPKTLGLFEKTMPLAKTLGDRFMIGRLNVIAAAMARWLGLSEEYVEERHEQLRNTTRLAQEAIDNFQPCQPGAWLKRAYGLRVDASNYLALIVETDIDKKRSVLREAIDSTRKAMTYEGHSFVTGMGHQLSRAMYLLATMNVGPEEATRLLKEALSIREDTVRTLERLSPHSFSRGMALNYLALIKAELSKIEVDPSKKLSLLRDASADMEQCVKLCATLTGITPGLPGQVRAQAQYTESQGDILQQLYNETLETSLGREAIHAYQQTISHLSKSSSLGPIPPVRWKIAQTHDSLREYKEASESFRQAASEYRLAGGKLPRLAPTFEEFAVYMEAWVLIEEARLKHDQELYAPAAENYASAANMLAPTKSWSHLSKHYSACSFLEIGEALSRQEGQLAAIESFKAAQVAFDKAKNALEAKLRGDPSSQAKELKDWLDITQGRLKYSLGRTQLEEAKVLDAKGEAEASSNKYRTASETFGSLVARAHDEQTRRELEALRLVCAGWSKMKAAEEKASPELYSEAADSFMRVERAAIGKRSRLAALANASMCRALESGSIFRRTRDRELYREIKRHLETAADFYEEASNRRAADWTRATQRSFDALTYLGEAEIETDPRKKTEFYHLAEQHLGLAANLYGDAGFEYKREEALRNLKRAREEKELLLTPIEALDQNAAFTEATFTPASLTSDQAGSIERFEAANVVGNASLEKDELSIGSEFTLELEMANVGKAPAMLIKLENIIPEGLELDMKKITHQVEDHHIEMRGRRLEYLKTHEVKLPLEARRKGAYVLRPRLLYVDEKGVYRSYEFEPTHVNVTEAAGRLLLESERKLSAVMFTDMIGYTSLTEKNEQIALELLEVHRRLLRSLFRTHRGREIKTMGDAFLVEFGSALEAVRCAIQIQEELSRRNLERSQDSQIHLRIGIHVGDVEHKQGDLYGEAVNVASRIERIAEPDGIAVSRQVYDQIRNHPGIEARSVGSRELKNVKESTEVFSISHQRKTPQNTG